MFPCRVNTNVGDQEELEIRNCLNLAIRHTLIDRNRGYLWLAIFVLSKSGLSHGCLIRHTDAAGIRWGGDQKVIQIHHTIYEE